MTRWWKWQGIFLSSSLGELLPVLWRHGLSKVGHISGSGDTQCTISRSLLLSPQWEQMQNKPNPDEVLHLWQLSPGCHLSELCLCARLQMCTNGWHSFDKHVQTASGRWTVLFSATLRPLCQFCSQPEMVYTGCFIFFMWTCSANCEAGILQLKWGGEEII